jgi:hypothetical protein
MERSVIRDKLDPDYAALHPGYQVGAILVVAPTAGDVRQGDPALHTSLTTANIS